MEADEIQFSKKTVLRYLQQSQPYYYLIPKNDKISLNYPIKCLEDPQDKQNLSQIISIDCEMILTQKGNQICRIIIINYNKTIIYDKWFLTQYPVVDYVTHITGITEDILMKNSKQIYNEQHKTQIMQIMKNKIVVGHDLANDFQVLDVKHQAFIDTVHLYPHNYGLPYKYKLKDLSMELLRKPIQWGHHNPFQDANATLQIVQKHLKEGKGVVQQVQFKNRNHSEFKDVWQIIQEAELKKQKIVALFLRGSRALGLEIDIDGYKSDWDYVCIYNTWAKINGRLIKFPQIDITIYDLQTFSEHINTYNDICYLELFFLPKQNQIINGLKFPQISIQRLRQSLGFHLTKTKMKIKRFKGDDSKRWKILKAAHLKIRFMDNFLQLFQFGVIKDVKRMNYLWQQFKEEYLKSGNFNQTLRKCETKANQFMEKVRETYKTIRKVGRMTQIRNDRSLKKEKENYQCIAKQKIILLHEDSSSFNFVHNPLHEKLFIVKQLRQNGFENLDQYKITMKRGKIHPNLIQFKYLQSASFKNPICKQVRGIIVDQDKNFQIVAFPYCKFFDYNDSKYSQIKQFNFKNYKIYEKFDGSIAFIYYYCNQWHVASSSVPDGQSNYCFARKQTTVQFRKQFWRIFFSLKFKLPQKQDRNKTFIFQLMSKNHIIVVNRTADQLILHGVRNIDTLKQQDHTYYGVKYEWKISEPIDLKIKNKQEPLPEIYQITENLDPLKQEGFIMCDDKYVRMKVKSSNYLRANWLGELNLTKNKDPSKYILIEIVLSGQADVFKKYCPEWQGVISTYIQKIQKLNNKVLQVYDLVKDLEKKQFALEVKQNYEKLSYFLFQLKNNFNFYKGRVENCMTPKKFYNFIKDWQQ